MRTKLDEFQTNIKALAEVTSQYASGSECGLPPPKIYHLEGGGTAKVWVLFEDEDVSIFKSIVSAGGIFPIHNHEHSVEVITLYRGAATYRSETVERVMEQGECVRVPKGKAHQVIAGPDGARFSVTTVPREPQIAEVIHVR